MEGGVINMIKYANESPVIAIVPPENQKERLDTFFYHPLFKDLDDRITSQTKDLTDINSISDFITDGTHQTPTYVEKENDGVLFLSATNIMEGGLSLEKVKYIPRSLHESYSNCQPSINDVMVAKNGKTGVACVFPSGIPECSIYVSIALVRLQAGWLPEFIALVINSELGFLQIQRNQKGIGVKNLHLEDIRQIQIPRIDEIKQQIIFNRYVEIEKNVKNIRKKSYQLKEKSEAVLEKAKINILNLLDDDWSEKIALEDLSPPIYKKPYTEIISKTELKERLDTHFYKPELRDIAKKIEKISNLVPLGEIIVDQAPISSGATPKGAEYLDEGIPFLRVQNVRPMSININDIVFIDEDTHKTLQRSCVKNGDVLLTITGATFGYSSVFKSRKYQEANVNQHIVRMRVDEKKAIPEFISLFLNSKLGYGQSLRHSTGGSRPALDFGSIRQFRVPCVTKSDQQKILDKYHDEEKKALNILQQSYELKEKSNTLLYKVKSNIFKLLKDDWFGDLVSEAKEALQ